MEYCKLIYNFINNTIPVCLNSFFTSASQHGHATRSSQHNGLTVLHFDQSSSPLTFYGPLFWNKLCTSLPHHLACILQSFKQ